MTGPQPISRPYNKNIIIRSSLEYLIDVQELGIEWWS